MFSLVNPSLLAHNVKTNANVGVTFHIEPNHSPRAGETAIAWFALTRQGGELIPLDRCDCNLAVYAQSSPNQPILNPELEAISPEAQYQDIPGAKIVFPEAGIYQLEMSGTPKADAEFEPFKLSYTVNVGPGITQPQQSQSSQPSPTVPQLNRTPSLLSLFPWLITAIAAVIVVGIIVRTIKSKKASERQHSSSTKELAGKD
jgi:hypothetical protein